MPEITISVNGVLKLLSNLKPHKAAGPDNIRPLVLFVIKSHQYYLFSFRNLLTQVSYRRFGPLQMSYLCSKNKINKIQSTIDPSH
ncbi:hypothetical protein DPMN_040693 [Dreissena polymorpha]|uniref:Uncharacterized protein n=1 Tax=Dreissena polymorpha TaxID=45954 RepID=A0A9D4CY54_DREPO|nr:hypothetical protein DPMN_040693 [Dreissena polymorpha]